MAKNGTEAFVITLPECWWCRQIVDRNGLPEARVRRAEYDFKTRQGPWAYGCEAHWVDNRLHAELGMGKGQKLIPRPDAIKQGSHN